MSYFGALDVVTWFKRAMRVTSLFGVYRYLVTHVRRLPQSDHDGAVLSVGLRGFFTHAALAVPGDAPTGPKL